MELIKELQKQEKAFSTEDYRMLKAVKTQESDPFQNGNSGEDDLPF